MGVRGSVPTVFTPFLSNWAKYVVVDGCWSNPVNVVTGVPLDCIFGTQLFSMHTLGRFAIRQKKTLAYSSSMLK